MYFFSKAPLKHVALLLLIFLIGFLAFVKVAPYRSQRIAVFLNPELDPLGIGYQTEQAKIAIGSGSIFGLGFGMSQQKYGALPHASSDSIFAVLAEESGLVGSIIILSLFLLFLWLGYKIGKESTNMFSKLTAFGITSWIFIQQLVNIGSMVGLLPLTGIPLPFISQGGSALIVEMAAVGILLNISRHARDND